MTKEQKDEKPLVGQRLVDLFWDEMVAEAKRDLINQHLLNGDFTVTDNGIKFVKTATMPSYSEGTTKIDIFSKEVMDTQMDKIDAAMFAQKIKRDSEKDGRFGKSVESAIQQNFDRIEKMKGSKYDEFI